MTELIYLTDSYKKELTSSIVSVTKKGDHWELVLDKTIFYPQGGGQPSDVGKISGPQGTLKVTHVRLQLDEVIHEGKLEGSVKIGDSVTGSIDWSHRYHNMRVHSAGHVVHEAVMAVGSGLIPEKGEHGDHPYIQYQGSIPPSDKLRIEQQANGIVAQNLPIATEFVTIEELKRRSPYVPEHLPKHKPLRIMTIGDFGAVPDGGTQVKETGEIGTLSITAIDNEDTTVTVYYAVEQLAQKQTEETGTLSAEQYIGLLLEAQTEALASAKASDKEAELLTIEVLGAKSSFGQLAKQIRTVPQVDRNRVGILLNEIKKSIESTIANRIERQETPFETQGKGNKRQVVDVTMPGHIPLQGHYHPTTLVIRQMNAIFAGMGFSIMDGPELENDEYNYNRVNLPLDHPARDLQDSLYIREPDQLLRTHTSSVEAHILVNYKPPFRFVIPGKVYRYENANATNNIMFYQYEGMAVSTDITMSDLKGTLDTFVKKFFGPERETRFRCKYYPQVEPGVGVDISCAFCDKKGCTVCKGRGWIEMLGAGMVHPNMLRRVNLDPSVYSGFAWGMGLDRIVMQRYGVTDIRTLYNGDIGYKE